MGKPLMFAPAPLNGFKKSVMMDLARAGNLFHQDSEVSEVTRLLQSSRE